MSPMGSVQQVHLIFSVIYPETPHHQPRMAARTFSSARHRMSPMGSVQQEHLRFMVRQQLPQAGCPFLHLNQGRENTNQPKNRSRSCCAGAIDGGKFNIMIKHTNIKQQEKESLKNLFLK
jgi:hypothetical protein